MKKHISYRSSELLKSLNERDQSFFTLREAMAILTSSEPAAVRRLLTDMTKRGLILRIKDGLYNVIPYEKNSIKYFPNWHLAAEAIIKPREYYIGYYSALDIHGLITQPSLIEQVVTEKQVVPKHQIIKNVKFEFITFNTKRFFGFQKTWIDDFNKVHCSDIEKTIIDCLYKPVSAGGIPEIIKALHKIRNEINQDRMLSYLKKFDAQVVYKRLGFIFTHLEEFELLRKEISSIVSSSYTLLDPSLAKKGKHFSEWRIIDNVDIDSAINAIST
jgi:predicted transcriptional regulator of viral defense system